VRFPVQGFPEDRGRDGSDGITRVGSSDAIYEFA
jgi:hypothetical protein